MKFGTEYGNIFALVTCPACNAQAALRGRKETGTRIIVRVVCAMCHTVRYAGITNVETIRLYRIQGQLEQSLETQTNPRARARIQAKLDEISRRQSLAGLFLSSME